MVVLQVLKAMEASSPMSYVVFGVIDWSIHSFIIHSIHIRHLLSVCVPALCVPGIQRPATALVPASEEPDR